MKTSIFLGLVLSFQIMLAQVPANKTVYNCNNGSKNIYATLATGKSIIVAHKGVDCSICRNSAPGWQTWAAANTSKVEVWGAITYTYNPNQFTPANACQKTLTWKNQYNWNDIFTFADSSRSWVNGGSPRYYVYSAIDSTIVYQGSSSSTARSMAIAQSTVGIKKIDLKADLNLKVSYGELSISSSLNRIKSVQLFSVDGKLILNQLVNSNFYKTNISEYTKGSYIILVEDINGNLGTDKIVL